MHNAAFKHLGLDWHYEALDVAPAELPDAFERAQNVGVLGMNVTVPHKIAALTMVDEVDASATLFGAINTVVNTADKFVGHNTDDYGLVQALREEFQLELGGKSVVILGAGGAGQVAAMVCATANVRQLFLVNRTTERAAQLAEKVRASFPSAQVQVSLPSDRKADLMINATSLGLHRDDPKPIVCEQVKGVPLVYDMIYRPAETKFLRCARDAGARTANGLSMLLHQGVRALELWLAAHAPVTGLRAPVEVMREALRRSV